MNSEGLPNNHNELLRQEAAIHAAALEGDEHVSDLILDQNHLPSFAKHQGLSDDDLNDNMVAIRKEFRLARIAQIEAALITLLVTIERHLPKLPP